MGIVFRFQGGPQAGRTEQFGDDLEQIVLGRDRSKCHVLFPAETTSVGREHCALKRVLSRYRLVRSDGHVVLIDGKSAHDGQEIPLSCDLQLGIGGPQLIVETTLNSDLPPTIRHESVVPGTWTTAQNAATRSRWSVVGAIVAMLFGVVLCVVGLGVQGRLKKQITKIEALTVGDIELLSDLRSHSRSTTQISTSNDALKASLQKAAASVYLVLLSRSSEFEEPIATAWVVDRDKGILATNCHVAQSFIDLKEGERLVVASGSSSPREFRVESVQFHPGDEAFSKLWDEYVPVREEGRWSWERIKSAGRACDVALMRVADPEGLADALPLATPEVLRKLDPGTEIGFVGFPMEGIAMGGVNVKRPVPTIQFGRVTAVTDFLDVSQDDWEENLLIHNSLPGSGGDSGSPVLNAAGQVVGLVSAGNPIGKTETGIRMWSAAQISYAQRVDLVKELLDETADQRQIRRTENWNREVPKYYRRYGEVSREAWMSLAKKRWLADFFIRFNGEYECDGNEKLRFESTVNDFDNATHEFQFKRDFTIDDNGDYLLVAIAEFDSAITLETKVSEADEDEQLLDPEEDSFSLGWLHTARFAVKRHSKIQVTMSSDKAAPAAGKLLVFKLEKSLIPIDVRIEKIVRGWISDFAGMEPKMVEQSSGVLELREKGLMASKKLVDLPLSGDYLALAFAPGGEDINLGVASEAPGNKLSKMDFESLRLARVNFSLTEATAVTILVVGEDEGIPWQLRLYHAVPAPAKSD